MKRGIRPLFCCLLLTLGGGLYGGDIDAFLELCIRGTAEEIAAAIAAGEPVNGANANDVTPLMRAAGYNPDPAGVLPLLLAAGAKVNAANVKGQTPLMYAAGNAGPAALSILLEAGADVHAVDDNGESGIFHNAGNTALFYAAAENPDPQAIRVLLDHGAEVNKTSNSGNTPLMDAAAFNPNPAAVMALLIEAGAPVNARDQHGITALTLAGRREFPDAVTTLLAAGAEVDALSNDRRTP
jgi:ankyrin repeat protein